MEQMEQETVEIAAVTTRTRQFIVLKGGWLWSRDKFDKLQPKERRSLESANEILIRASAGTDPGYGGYKDSGFLRVDEKWAGTISIEGAYVGEILQMHAGGPGAQNAFEIFPLSSDGEVVKDSETISFTVEYPLSTKKWNPKPVDLEKNPLGNISRPWQDKKMDRHM